MTESRRDLKVSLDSELSVSQSGVLSYNSSTEKVRSSLEVPGEP